jgi:hypothetical protein
MGDKPGTKARARGGGYLQTPLAGEAAKTAVRDRRYRKQ